MEVTKRIYYDIDKSAERMDNILSAGDGNYEDLKTVPSRDNLTYTNGYYVYITALFIDIVGSSEMTDEHTRPVLAKTYRSFISECTAIMNDVVFCKEININGDCVWGVFETLEKHDIDMVFGTAAKLISLIRILNYKLKKKGYSQIAVGLGMDYGRALMIKSGYSGSGLNDVIWMGDVVNSACHLCGQAGRNGRKPLFVSSCIYGNLNEHNKRLLTAVYPSYNWSTIYEGDIINTTMQDWYNENCI